MARLDHIGSVKHGVVTLENHVAEGCIGSLVTETMADARVGTRLIRLGLKDTYFHGGLRPYLMCYYGLDAVALVVSEYRNLRGKSVQRYSRPDHSQH